MNIKELQGRIVKGSCGLDAVNSITLDGIENMAELIRGENPPRSVSDDLFKEASYYGVSEVGSFIDLINKGWPEGKKRAMAMLNSLEIPSGTTTRKAINLSVCGYAPNVGAYLQGRPDCMYRFTNEAEKNSIRVALPVAYSYKVKPRSIELFGAAMVALVMAIEIKGYSVEIDVIATVKGKYRSQDFFELVVPIKDGDEILDIDRLVFVTSHRAFLRVGVMRVMDSCPTYIRDILGAYTPRGGYGRPYPILQDTREKYDFTIDGMSAMESDDEAIGWIKNQLKNLKVEVE